jgi:mono/diheme cytochrome c family protein
MPYGFYKVFTSSDVDAVVTYLRSVPAVSNKVQAPVYKAPLHSDVPPGGDKPMSAADLRDPVKRGFYQVTIAHCMECHSPRVNGRLDMVNGLGKGGEEFKGPWGVSVSRNITSHREKGIGAWSDAEIKRAITQGVRKDGSQLKPPMGFAWYARMTDADLNDMVAYLRTVPPKE